MNIRALVTKYRNTSVGEITGEWTEDGNPFIIKCPHQLQPYLKWVLDNLGVTKIQIKCSQNADTRSADKKVTENELFFQSGQHIEDVQKAISWMKAILQEIAEKHDYTKLENIKEFHNNFKFIQDGNVGDFKKMNWFQEFHLKERHHLNDRCPEDVNLFDVLERIADITMAGLARTGKIYDDSLSPEILTRAYKNTIEMIKINTEVENA